MITNSTSQHNTSTSPRTTVTSTYNSALLPPPQSPSIETALKADFSITLQSESTTKLNETFQRLMDTIHATPGLAIRGPIRLPKDGKIHSRRIDIKSIPEWLLRDIGLQSSILLAEDAGEERIQENGVVVSFDIE
jgi:ribosomal protein S10